jgi:hypothetical protein
LAAFCKVYPSLASSWESTLGAFLLSPHLLRHPPLLAQIPSSDLPPSKIAKEFVGWMKSGPKDIEDLREEYELLGWRVILLEVTTHTPLTISLPLKKKRPTGKVINGCNAKII